MFATEQGHGVETVITALHLKHVLAAFVLVGVALGLRLWPLQAFESELTWLTFYPAVIAATLYAGFYAGVLATVLACLAVTFLWSFFVAQPFIENRLDLVEMAIFAGICGFISYLVDVLQRTKKALKQAKCESMAATEREQFIRSIVDCVPNMIGYWDKDLRCRYANHAYHEWFGMSPEEVIGIRFQDLAGERLFALNEPHIRGVLAGEPQRFERTLNKASENLGYIIGHYIPDFDADGTVKGFSIQASEVTVLKETEARLELAACVFENTLDGVMITGADGVILSVNPAFIEITGFAAEEAIGHTPRMLYSDLHDDVFYSSMWNEVKSRGRWNGEIWNRRKDGNLYLVRMTISMVRVVDGEPVRYVSVFSDITELWRKDEHIKHLAFHDTLTGLPNRNLLMDRVNQKIIHSNREQSSLALMFLDLDGFKLVNDQFGHKGGDDLLQRVAARLQALVRESDTVARVGGDEFIFVLDNPKGKDEIMRVANRVVSAINEPMNILGEVIQIGTSVGVAMFPADARTYVDLMKSADTAMYAAKIAGRNNISFFSAEGDFTKDVNLNG